MKFELTDEQVRKAEEFKKSFDVIPTAIGGGFTYEFTPTSIGTMIRITYANGEGLWLTEDL